MMMILIRIKGEERSNQSGIDNETNKIMGNWKLDIKVKMNVFPTQVKQI